MCSEPQSDLLQSELLVFCMKNMSGFQLTFSSNDFSLLSDVCFTEWGEVAVGGKLQPAHSSPILCFLPTLIFYMQQFDLLEHGGWVEGRGLPVVSSYTCNFIVPLSFNRLLFLSEHLCTPVSVLFYASNVFHLLTRTYQGCNLGTSLSCFYFFFLLLCVGCLACL